MRRRTKIVLAVTFMVAALVTGASYIYISQMLSQRVSMAHESAMYLTPPSWMLTGKLSCTLTRILLDRKSPTDPSSAPCRTRAFGRNCG